MKQSIALLVLAFIFGSGLSAQNSKPDIHFKKANSTETGSVRKAGFETPTGPQSRKKMQWGGENRFPGIERDGKVPLKSTPDYKISRPNAVKSATEGVATITLNVVGNPFEGCGFQILLDKDHGVNFDAIMAYSYYELNEMSEYSIPENANVDLDNPLTVLNEAVSIAIPEGTYDLVAAYYDPEFLYFAPCNWYEEELEFPSAFGDDFLFKAGYEYIFTVSEYSYVETDSDSDLALRQLNLPASSPDLTDSEEISVVVKNVGTQTVTSFDLSYLINNGDAVTETVTETLEPDAEMTCTFNTKANLSATGMYNITARVISDGDTKPLNDQKKGSVKHSGSISLPYNCTFMNSGDLQYWDIRMIENCNYTMDEGWSADPGSNSLQFYISQVGATNVNGCLVSADPLIFPEAGTYHLTFQAYTYGTEKVKVLYGTSDNVDEMTVANEYTLPPTNEWPLYITNFDVLTAGNYYVALQYHSDASEGGWGLNFDNITVDRGVFVGIPELSFSRLLVPGSSCDLTAETVLGARIQNRGTEPVQEFTLTYRVNDNPAVSQTFNEAIGIRESKEVYFSQKSDLSAPGNYEIKISVSTPNEENTGNNKDSLAIIHYEPLTGLPLESDFSNRADRLEWTSTVANGWIANNYYGCLFPRDYAPDPLLSRCITMEPGYYRFTYFYSAGLTTPYGVALDDFYIAYGRSGTDPFGWTKVKEYRQKNTGGSLFVEEDAIVLDITEAGEYVVGVFPVNIGDLSIYKASISLLQEHDVRISSVESPPSFTRITPKSQVAHEHVFNVHVQNRGTGEETVSLELKLNDVSLATENFSLTFNEEKNIPLRAAFPVPAADSLYLQFSASIAGDQFPEDNSLQIIKVVSDSTFVNDREDSDFWYGFGVEGTTGTFGHIYELKEKDVLTSINVGLVEIYYSVDFGIAVYPVGDDLVLGDPLIRQEQERVGGASTVFDLPDTELEPGKYFFGVQQITPDNIYLVYDLDPKGYFYFDDGNGKLDLIGASYGLGSIHVRPNFGESKTVSLPEVKAANPVLQLYPNPVVDVLSVHAAGQQIKNVSVYSAAGATVYKEQGINSSEYKLNTGSLAPGLYFITVQTPAGVKTDKFAVKK